VVMGLWALDTSLFQALFLPCWCLSSCKHTMDEVPFAKRDDSYDSYLDTIVGCLPGFHPTDAALSCYCSWQQRRLRDTRQEQSGRCAAARVLRTANSASVPTNVCECLDRLDGVVGQRKHCMLSFCILY
jgi:hypothetical protein